MSFQKNKSIFSKWIKHDAFNSLPILSHFKLFAHSHIIGRYRRIIAVAKKEFRQLMRDQLTLGFVVGVPAVQLLLFGYAINQDVRNVNTAVIDHSNSFISRHLVGQLEATQTFRITERPASESEGMDLLKKGLIHALVVVPPDYTRAYYRGRGAEISILVDATDPILARAVKASADGLMEQHNKRLQTFAVRSYQDAIPQVCRFKFL